MWCFAFLIELLNLTLLCNNVDTRCMVHHTPIHATSIWWKGWVYVQLIHLITINKSFCVRRSTTPKHSYVIFNKRVYYIHFFICPEKTAGCKSVQYGRKGIVMFFLFFLRPWFKFRRKQSCLLSYFVGTRVLGDYGLTRLDWRHRLMWLTMPMRERQSLPWNKYLSTTRVIKMLVVSFQPIFRHISQIFTE